MATKNRINIVVDTDASTKPLKEYGDELDRTGGKADKLGSALGAVGSILGKTALAIGAAGIAAGTAGATIGFGFNSSVEQAQTKLTAFMKDGDKVAQTLAWVKNEAAATQFSFTEMADAAANLTPVAKMSGVALEDLVKEAEILASLNPAEGLTGAAFSLREALTGDWVSIVDRFNLPRKRINELKEQGVPAMEIITQTLGEMGIGYDLVAKQGKTVSARFDQIKDKMTMMAGAAAKPIFDKVSIGLDALGKFDYQAVGVRAGKMLDEGMLAAERFIPKVMKVGEAVGAYLGPKFTALGTTIMEDLIPALGHLWRDVLEPLMPVLGESLVVALGAAVDALSWFLRVLSPLIPFLADNQYIIWGVVGAFAAFKTALAIEAGVGAFQAGIAAMTGGNGLAGLMGTLEAARGRIATPMVLGSLGVGAALMALQMVIDKHFETQAVLEKTNELLRKNDETSASTDAAMKKRVDEGKMSQEQYQNYLKNTSKVAEQEANNIKAQYSGAIGTVNLWLDRLMGSDSAKKFDALTKKSGGGGGGFATGTTYAPGGQVLVGEHGPERVTLPRGAIVEPAFRTAQSAPSAGHTVIIEQFNSYGERDNELFLRDIGFALEAA